MLNKKGIAIGVLFGLLIGLWFGINLGRDKPIYKNPFTKRSLQEKLISTGRNILQKSGEALEKSGQVIGRGGEVLRKKMAE